MGGTDPIVGVFKETGEFAARLRSLIAKYLEKLSARGLGPIRMMNFCGTHEWSNVRHGLRMLGSMGLEFVLRNLTLLSVPAKANLWGFVEGFLVVGSGVRPGNIVITYARDMQEMLDVKSGDEGCRWGEILRIVEECGEA